MKNSALPVLTLAAIIFVSSCSTPRNISYLQDVDFGVPAKVLNVTEIRVQPEDKISIVISSKDPLLAEMFNLPVVTYRVGSAQSSSAPNQSQSISVYTVDRNGEIDFPVLGKVSVEGKVREEIAAMIKDMLMEEQLVKDPVVTVEFANLYVSVLGEVNNPGRYTIDRDKVSILDAIGMAGDLTIFGQRERVIVLRDVDGKQIPYKVDLTSAYDLYASPVFYLQQKDVVYVEPNKTRARQSTVNGNNVRSTSFWISLASLATSIAVLVTK